MPFFMRKKRGGAAAAKGRPAREPRPDKDRPARPVKQKRGDVEISSESEEDELAGRRAEAEAHDSDEETPQAKRRRLAKEILSQVKAKAAAEASDGDEEGDEEARVRSLLADSAAAKAGRLHRAVAKDLRLDEGTKAPRLLKGLRKSPTCLVVSSDGRFVVAGAKDGSILKWDTASGSKVGRVAGRSPKAEAAEGKKGGGHRGEVLALALSSDDKFLCSGGADKRVQVWDFGSLEPVKSFTGHRGPVTGLCFRRGTHELFSGSQDRSVKVWSLDDLGYVDTMFGHQDGVEAMDALGRERFISCGGRDRSIRMWKVAEESQLLFRPHNRASTVDTVRLINEEKFVSGADDGSVSLWSGIKKKPLHTEFGAHEGEEPWISAVAPLLNTDLLATGSGDGWVCLWEVAADYKGLRRIGCLPAPGFVTDLRWAPDGSVLAVSVGREPKRGRWFASAKAKDAVLLFAFPKLF